MSVRSLQCVTFFTLATNHYYGRIVTLLLKSYVVLIFIYNFVWEFSYCVIRNTTVWCSYNDNKCKGFFFSEGQQHLTIDTSQGYVTLVSIIFSNYIMKLCLFYFTIVYHSINSHSKALNNTISHPDNKIYLLVEFRYIL